MAKIVVVISPRNGAKYCGLCRLMEFPNYCLVFARQLVAEKDPNHNDMERAIRCDECHESEI